MVILRKNQKKIFKKCLKLQNDLSKKIGILTCPLGFGKTIIGKKLIDNKKELIVTREHLKKNWEECYVINEEEYHNIQGEFDLIIFDDADLLDLKMNKQKNFKAKFIWLFSNNADDFRYLTPIWKKNDRYLLKKGGKITNQVILAYIKSIKNIECNIVEFIANEKNEEINFFKVLELLRSTTKEEKRLDIFKKYRLKYEVLETNSICPISGITINNAIITSCCNNKFSEKELASWILDYKPTCPLCRNVIKNFDDIIFTNKNEIKNYKEIDWNKKIMIYCNDDKITSSVSKKLKLKNTNINRINDFIKGLKNIFVISNTKVIRGINLKIDTILFYKIDNKEIFGKFKNINPKINSFVVFNPLQLTPS